MRHHAVKLFTRVRTDSYGPADRNSVYTVTAKTGVTYDVKRHRWTIPSSGWGWRAVPVVPPNADGTRGHSALPSVFGDTLGDIAATLGILPDDWHDMVN